MLSIEIQKIHKQHPDMGYRRIRDELEGHKGIHVNDKRVLRICRKCDIKSNIKWKPKSCTRGDRNPDHIAKNYLHRDFHANKPNEKWLTDVSEFKYYNGIEVHKVYLSAILDLYDRRIVAFKISDHNDNPLVMSTFDEAVRLTKRPSTVSFRSWISIYKCAILYKIKRTPYETKYVQSCSLYR